MARLKTRQELEQERIDAQRYALGNVTLNTEKLLLIYARQSSSKQYVSNIYSAMEQRDGLLERATAMGWTKDEQWILYVENQLAKKTQVSGSLRIDQRPGLQALTEVIESGKASAVLVVSVDRITRDEDLITPTTFANLCKKYGVLIITDEYVYDFNNPTRNDIGKFMNESIAAKEYVRVQIRGKMLKNRTRKANMGRVANGVTPIGLMLDQSVLDAKKKAYNLIPSPHAERVNWLYGRFKALDANLAALLGEVIGMAKRGEPLFPDVPGWTPDRIHMKRMKNGWTVSTRYGLKYILTNPMYQGHLVFNNQIVKMNAHPAIVDTDTWNYAFNHLSDVDLEGNEIKREARTVRYTQGSSKDSNALLLGTRHTGKAVIDSVNGAHVYVHMPDDMYQIKQWDRFTVSGYETAINTKELDRIITEKLLQILRDSERSTRQDMPMPHKTMDTIEQSVQPTGTVQDDLNETNQELARVQRALKFQDSMSDERLEETLKKEARLIKRRAELEQAQDNNERLAREREQAKDDIETASTKWASWKIEKRRQFIRMVTESITLEEIATGWLRLVIVWSPILGMLVSVGHSIQSGIEYSIAHNMRSVHTCYIWRQAGKYWTDDEKALLHEKYPTERKAELLRLFPSRSWAAIVAKAIDLSIPKELIKRNEDVGIPNNTSLSDMKVVSEFMLQPAKRVQWKTEFRKLEGTNEICRTEPSM